MLLQTETKRGQATPYEELEKTGFSGICVLPAKCRMTHNSFLMRFGEIDGVWHLIEAFRDSKMENALRSQSVKKISFTGGLIFEDGYECPYCGAKTFARCGYCERISCFDYDEAYPGCAHCGIAFENPMILEDIDVSSDPRGDF